jgi:hypothetical protein
VARAGDLPTCLFVGMVLLPVRAVVVLAVGVAADFDLLADGEETVACSRTVLDIRSAP